MVSGFGWTHEKLAPTGVVAVGRWDHVWMTKTTCQHLIWSQVLHSFPNFYPRYRCPWGTGRLDDWGVNPGVGDILIFAGWHPLDCWTIYPCFVAWIPSNPREVCPKSPRFWLTHQILQPQWPNRLLPCPALGLEFTNKNGRSAMSTPKW